MNHQPDFGQPCADRYACPYCRERITAENVLFWHSVRTPYPDDRRGRFLRSHGMKVPDGYRFPRVYYRVRPGKNVAGTDAGGFPTLIRDIPSNAVLPGAPDEAPPNGSGSGPDVQPPESAGQLTITQRACPCCHCELPADFGVFPIYHVLLHGSRGSGKTAFLANLFRQIGPAMSGNRLGTLTPEGESAGFLRLLADAFEKNEPGNTFPEPDADNLLPVICRFRSPEPGHDAFIVLHPFENIHGRMTAPYEYEDCSALLLLVGPNTLLSDASFEFVLAEAHRDRETSGLPDRYMGAPLDQFLMNTGEMCRTFCEKIRSVVCVATKTDLLQEADPGCFGPDPEVLKDIGDSHCGTVSLPVLRQVEQELFSCMSKTHRFDMEKKLRNSFGGDIAVCFLGVSASRDGNDRRVVEPLLLLLAQYGLVPVRDETPKEAAQKKNVRRFPFLRKRKA